MGWYGKYIDMMSEGIEKYYDGEKKMKIGRVLMKMMSHNTVKCVVNDGVKRLRIGTSVRINKNIKSIKKRDDGRNVVEDDLQKDDAIVILGDTLRKLLKM